MIRSAAIASIAVRTRRVSIVTSTARSKREPRAANSRSVTLVLQRFHKNRVLFPRPLRAISTTKFDGFSAKSRADFERAVLFFSREDRETSLQSFPEWIPLKKTSMRALFQHQIVKDRLSTRTIGRALARRARLTRGASGASSPVPLARPVSGALKPELPREAHDQRPDTGKASGTRRMLQPLHEFATGATSPTRAHRVASGQHCSADPGFQARRKRTGEHVGDR